MVSVENVTVAFGARNVLENATLDVPARTTTALIGASGSGKSTLLRAILGMVPLSAGRVRVNGKEVTRDSARGLRRRMGYVIQEGGLFPHMTAKDNVVLVARLERRDTAFMNARVKELAALVHLDAALLERYPAQLSGGERQRVGLMRALALDPDVLLLDEPLGALDPMVRAQLQKDLGDIFRTLGKCVVLVTHDMAEAATLAESIAVMRDGKIVQRGPMRELVDAPVDAYVTEFVRAQRSLVEALR